METTWCPTKISPKYVSEFWDLTWRPMFDQDETANLIYSTWKNFQDKLDPELFNKHIEEAYKIMWDMSPETKQYFIDDVRKAANQIAQDSEWVDWFNKWYQARRVSDVLKFSEKYDDKIIANIKYIEDEFLKKSYTPYKLFQTMNKDTWLVDIYNGIVGSMKYPFLLQDWVKPSNLEAWLKSFGEERWLWLSDAQRFANDMMAIPLLNKQRWEFIWWMKSMYSTMKFSPLTSPIGGSLTLVNNTLLWVNLILSKRRWVEWIMSSNAVDYLIDTEKFLASESRSWDILKSYYDQDWKNFFNRQMDRIFARASDNVWWERMRTIIQWWIHNAWDMIMENTWRRLVITEALSKNWINKWNIELFYQNLKENKINPDFLLKLRWDAWIGRQRFRTTWGNTSLNRNRFSRRRVINTLQNYMINRADDVWSWVKQFSQDLRSGEFKTYWDFADYLTEKNPQLKSILNNVLTAAKIWIYINAMTDTRSWEDKESTVWKYVTNMSDYISSLKWTFFYRIFTAPVEWLSHYYDYTSATWKSEEFKEWVSVAALHTLATITSQLRKEWKILNILSDTAIWYLKTWDVDLSKAIAADDLDKILNWAWRFSLLPGVDTYWQKGIEWKSDMIWRLTFAYPEFNKAAWEYQRLRDMWEVDKILSDRKNVALNTMTYLPVLNSIYKWWEKSPTSQYTAASWKVLQDEIQNNPTMQKIWNWEFPSELLDNPKTVDNLYKELTSLSYYNKKLVGKWEFEVSSYWLTPVEEKVFTQNIINWLNKNKKEGAPEITLDTLQWMLEKWWKKADFVKVMAAMNANEPGSSKIMISYLANDELYKMKLAKYGKGFANIQVSPEAELDMEKQIVSKYYPYLWFADQTAQFKLARTYMAQHRPEVFASMESDATIKWFVNTLAFNDMVMWSEAKQWDVDAQYIKNIFSASAKYIQDPTLRTKLVSNSLDTISALDWATQSQKQLMRIWVLSANIDHYDKIKKDPILSITNKDDIQKFENTIRWTNHNLNAVWIAWIEKDMNEKAKSQYYGSKLKPYIPNKYASSNQKAQSQFQDQVNRVYNPAQQWTTYKQPTPTYRLPTEKGVVVNIAQPKEYSLYYKVYDDQYKATSDSLTRYQSVRNKPTDTVEWTKFTKPSYWKTIYKAPGTRIPTSRKAKPKVSLKRNNSGG